MPKYLPTGKVPNEQLATLIRKLPTHDDAILIPPGIGLDAAALRIGGQTVAISTDPITFATKDVAKYSMRVNVNDIACAGCKPRWYTGVLLLPENTTEKALYDLWSVMADELKRFDVCSIGGHTEVTPNVNKPILVGQIIGEPVTETLYDARNAKVGDKILLWRGAALEGTALLASERYDDLSSHILPEQLDTMVGLLDDPGICILDAAKALYDIDGIVAMHDPTEGGVATALHEMADAAGCGLEVDASSIPILSETLQLAKVLNFDPLGLLASGSLLVICKPGVEELIKKRLKGGRIEVVATLTDNAKTRQLHYNDHEKSLPRFDRDEVIDALTVVIE
jgi:hydrogenase expression/formation protein HypE